MGKMDKAITVLLALFVVAILGPTIFAMLGGAGSTYVVIGNVNQTFAQWVGSGGAVYIVFTVLLPVLGIIALVMIFWRGSND